MSELTMRVAALYGAIALIAAVWAIRRVARGEIIAATLATIWAAIALVPINLLASLAGWWQFTAPSAIDATSAATTTSLTSATSMTALGLPLDLHLSWALLWGAWPALAFPRLPLAFVVAIMLALDLVVMPLCEPIVRLGDRWLAGEAVAIAVALVPAQLLARWTRDDRHLGARAALQVCGFSLLVLWLLPAVILERTGGGWDRLLGWHPVTRNLVLQVLAVPAILGLSAVCEFVRRGRGTPIPWDPPRHLVTTGPYAYVANPMQLAMTLVLIGWGAVLGSWWVMAAAAMAVVYGSGLAAWDEDRDLRARFGERWTMYRRGVRTWWPRWRPFIVPDRLSTPARLYVAASCGQCSALGRWIAAQRPLGLEIVAAESHPTRDLQRLTYDPNPTECGSNAHEEEGVAALARALEHINLMWAFVGMTLRLPIVRMVVQALVDASGGGPRRIRRTPREIAECGIRGPATGRGSSALPS